MNFIFISPHFPYTYWQFCNRVIELGPNGIIDKRTEYDDYITDERIQQLREKIY